MSGTKSLKKIEMRAGGERVPSGAKLMATALAAGTCAVLAIFLAFAVYYDISSNSLRRQEINNYLETVGSSTAWGVENWLMNRITLAEDVASSISNAPQASDLVTHLRSPVYEKTFIWTYYGEANGAYHIWPPDDQLPDDYDPRTRPWYQAAARAGVPTLTEPYYDITTNVETITVAAPVFTGGKLAGVVGADFSTATLSEVLMETDLGGLGHAFLVSGDGVILAHPDPAVTSKKLEDIYPGATPTLGDGVQYVNGRTAQEIVAFTNVDALNSVDWRLGLSLDQNSAYAAQDSFRISAAIAAIAASVLMVMVLGYVIHRLLVQPLTKARAQADAANVAKSEFLASMSHEIRTPMNGVLGMTQVLTNTKLDDRQRELTSIILSSGNALMTVIDDILYFAKLEAGKLRMTPRAFNLRQTVFEVATMMQARALEKQLELIVRYDPALPEGVVADDARLRQVLGNLIGNAVKFTERGYVLIDVTGERLGDSVKLTVSVKDSGIGVAEEDLPRMFEKFEQADGSHTRKFGGTGLGLAICKNIVELMEGDIGAESAVGEGSRFWFRLSLPVDESIKSMPAVDSKTFDGVRVLAVDDNAVNRRVLEELLDGWGMRVSAVMDSVSAFAALERSIAESDRYHAILLDYQMPDEDGAALAKRIQADPRFAALPIIILSSIDNAQVSEQEGGPRIAAYLPKPVRPSQLMDELTQVLSDEAATSLKRLSERMRIERETAQRPEYENRAKILIVEDNPVNRMVVTNLVGSDDYETVIAENGAEAVDLFTKSAPDIVLMDLSMPVMDGLEATRRIRAMEKERGLSRTPIIATTAHVLEEDRQRCRDAGMDDFVAKPIKKTAIDGVLERWLEQSETKAARSA